MMNLCFLTKEIIIVAMLRMKIVNSVGSAINCQAIVASRLGKLNNSVM